MQHVVKTVYEDEDIKVKVECINSVPFLHLEVERYSKSVKKKIQNLFMDLAASLYGNGWDEMLSYSSNKKFCRILPEGEIIDEIDYSGETYEVIKWELKQLLQ